MMYLYSFLGALLLAATHLLADKLKLVSLPRSKWLSFAGGISVSYAFIHLLPELAENQESLHRLNFVDYEHLHYLIALLGLAVFYGLERAAKKSTHSNRDQEATSGHHEGIKSVFWLHIVSFALYNTIIGYLLAHEEGDGWTHFVVYVLAMSFHFLVNDYALSDHYEGSYHKKGRWILTGAIFLGWISGVFLEIPEEYLALLFAFIAGGTILNIMKEELPGERESNFWAFGTGLILYTTILFLL